MFTHIPVLSNQVIGYLKPLKGETFIDCTLGLGGHAELILEHLGVKGQLYGIDADRKNFEQAKKRLKNYKNITFVHDNFENLEQIAGRVKSERAEINGILFDLGLSSPHVDDPERGFSFQGDGPLDMRYDASKGISAAEIINTYPLQDLVTIFRTYGEEKYAYRIAKEIERCRKSQHFTRTQELANAIKDAVTEHGQFPFQAKHPATRVFQALRIAANREVEALSRGLEAAIKALSSGGRIVIISYHSLEDRIVKNALREAKKAGALTLLTKKPVTPAQEELRINPRSRSALLRAAVKIIKN